MIEVRNINYQYRKGDFIFKNISLSLPQGKIIGLYGKSGLGKTTLAKIMAGYNHPISGKVLVDNKPYPVKGRNPVQLIWQHPEKAINPRWRLKKVMKESGISNTALMQQLKINSDWLRRYPSELSGGELQRFCVARALHPKTKYIIADEMTTMLDALTQVQIWQVLISAVKERNIGVLAISHNRELLKQISDNIVNFNELITSPINSPSN